MSVDIEKKQEFGQPVNPPGNLLSRIMRRLGLERQLVAIKKNIEVFSTGLVLGVALCAVSFIGLRQVLMESNFGPFVSLLFTDPDMVLRYWGTYILSVMESIPGAHALMFLLPVAAVLILAKIGAIYIDKFLTLTQTIHNQNHEHK